MAETDVGAVQAVWRFPVKSMLGERLDSAPIGAGGILGDRGYALVDSATGKVVSAKQPRLWSRMLECHAAYVDEPGPGPSLPPASVTLPDGGSVTTDSPDFDQVMSSLLGRPVMVASCAPEDFTIDDYHPEIEELGPEVAPGTVTEEKLGAALFAEAGLPSPVPSGAFFDVFPLSLLTTSTLAKLGELATGSVFDPRRFRMNVIVDSVGTGFVENEWLGRTLNIGGRAAATVMMPDPRCVMTTLAQQDLPRDNAVLQTAARHNRLEVGGASKLPCVGVYAVVTSGGTVRSGDPVRIT